MRLGSVQLRAMREGGVHEAECFVHGGVVPVLIVVVSP